MTLLDCNHVGDCFVGQRVPARGVVRNFAVHDANYDGQELSFLVEGAPAGYVVGVYVDGALQDVVVASGVGQASASGLADGRHSVDVALNRAQGIWPDRHGNRQGNRAYLTWPRSADLTCAGYGVYRETAPDVWVVDAIVTGMRIEHRQFVRGSQGLGRFSVYGVFNGPVMNVSAAVTAVSDGTYSFTLGELEGSGTFSSGTAVEIGYGVTVQFHDDPEDYGSGSVVSFGVGPAWWHTTGALAAGTHRYRVAAIDGAGNESDPLAARSVFVPDVPGAADVVMEWQDPGLVVAFAVTAGVSAVYSNWNKALGKFGPYVLEDKAHAVVAAGGTWVFDPGAEQGTLLFYVRPVSGAGVEREDATLYRFGFPPAPDDVGFLLGTPTNVVATAIAGGRIRVEWDYRFRDGDDLVQFDVTIAEASPVAVFGGQGRVVSGDAGSGYPVAHFAYETEDAFEGTRYVVVRAAADVGFAVTTRSAEASVLADATAPVFAGVLRGVRQ